MLAAIRPPGQDFPVLLHIVGATIVFGALLITSAVLMWRQAGAAKKQTPVS